MTYHPQVATGTRTVNWNNMNFFRRTTKDETWHEMLIRSRWQRKVRIVQKILKRHELFDNSRTVIVSSRRFGKTTIAHRLFTQMFSLVELREALMQRDREAIKSALNKRINARGELYGKRNRYNKITS